jgi:prevent-host-death family protein
MKRVNVHEAKTNFSSLIALVEKSQQPIIICRDGKPVAELGPRKKIDRTKPHPLLQKIKIGYDPVEPLDDSDWPKAAR